ncbi:MAG: tetratricopeptide repeat protein [Bacteroidetes bacterium]|nr:tetratricopeptide repeat protein [Bacteroidota bacterium]
MRFVLISFICFISTWLIAQPNCNVYLWNGDTAQYKACQYLESNIDKYYQFSKNFHLVIDSALLICPRFAYAYREKAAPFVKSGNFIEWKKNIDLAVTYDSLIYLPVRASLRYKFFADYEGALADIEMLERLSPTLVEYTSNGTYHLEVVKALCYKQTGNSAKALAILEKHLLINKATPGLYDLLHLAVLYLHTGRYKEAEEFLLLQNKAYEYADTYFYLAQCYKQQNRMEAYIECKNKSNHLYKNGQKLTDPYNELFDQVYLSDIENL